MKIRLRLSRDTESEVRKELEEMGVEISPDAALILTEENYRGDALLCREEGERVSVQLGDIIYAEALGRDVLVHTQKKTYKTELRIYQLETMLPQERFVRISNAVIIRRDAIRRIRPAFGSKFYLTLVNGAAMDVTRTYYHRFKEYFGI